MPARGTWLTSVGARRLPPSAADARSVGWLLLPAAPGTRARAGSRTRTPGRRLREPGLLRRELSSVRAPQRAPAPAPRRARRRYLARSHQRRSASRDLLLTGHCPLLEGGVAAPPCASLGHAPRTPSRSRCLDSAPDGGRVASGRRGRLLPVPVPFQATRHCVDGDRGDTPAGSRAYDPRGSSAVRTARPSTSTAETSALRLRARPHPLDELTLTPDAQTQKGRHPSRPLHLYRRTAEVLRK